MAPVRVRDMYANFLSYWLVNEGFGEGVKKKFGRRFSKEKWYRFLTVKEDLYG